MEYKKDKRTKNLTLRDIHVGDWVQVWSEQAERYSPPLKIIQICDDGTIYLVTSDEERPTPWEEDIRNVDALPIDADLLRGFDFKQIMESGSFRYGNNNFYFNTNSNELHGEDCPACGFKVEYFHELQDWLDYLDYDINFEWEGIEK